MRFFSDQTYNNFVNEIVIETKDLPDGRPGQGDRYLSDDEIVSVDDPASKTVGTTSSDKYFYRCIHQLSTDIENEVYKTKETKKAEVEKERAMCNEINKVISQSNKNLQIPSHMQVANLDEQVSSTSMNDSVIEILPENATTVATATSVIAPSVIAPSVTTNSSDNAKNDDDFIKSVSPHKLNMINQNTNLQIALKEAENTQNSLTL